MMKISFFKNIYRIRDTPFLQLYIGVNIWLEPDPELAEYQTRILRAKLALYQKAGNYSALLQAAIEPLMARYRTAGENKKQIKTVISTLLSVCENVQQRHDQTQQEFNQQLTTATDKSTTCTVMWF